MERLVLQHPSFSSPQKDSGVAPPVLVTDGAMGTELERRGKDLTGRKLWSSDILFEDPDVVSDIHYSYLKAGSDILSTCTYQMYKDGATALNTTMETVVDKALQAVKKAVQRVSQEEESGQPKGGRLPLIAGSLGPYASVILKEFTGDYEPPAEGYYAFHRSRVEAFVEPFKAKQIDFIAMETFPRIDEALEAARCSLDLGIPFWVTFTLNPDNPKCMPSGDSFQEAVERLAELCRTHAAPASLWLGVGVNCVGPAVVTHLLQEFVGEETNCCRGESMHTTTAPSRVEIPRPSWVMYPNSGELYDPTRKDDPWYRRERGEHSGPATIPEGVPHWWELIGQLKSKAKGRCGGNERIVDLVNWEGPLVFGGCCRTTPEEVASIVRHCRGL